MSKHKRLAWCVHKAYNTYMTKRTPAKKPAAKSTAAHRAKPARSAKSKQPATPAKVDIYPNRMTVAISALAGTLLVLVTIIAVLGSRG